MRLKMNLTKFSFKGQDFEAGQIVNVEAIGDKIRLHELNGNVHSYFVDKAESEADKLQKYFVEEQEKPKSKPRSKKED